jgi:hypothetical protein
MPRDETARLRIGQFASPDGYPNSNEVWVVQEDGQWTLVSSPDQCPRLFAWPYSHFGSLCSGRALDVEDGVLLVSGQRLIAEAYLNLWRETRVVSPADAVRMGFSLTVELRRPVGWVLAYALRQNEARRAAFAALLRHSSLRESDGMEAWTLSLLDPSDFVAYTDLKSVYCPAEFAHAFPPDVPKLQRAGGAGGGYVQ